MVVSPRLRELVKATAKKLNRPTTEAEPFLTLLSDNWYDTVDSLKVVQVADLQALGIPQRFSKELLQLAQSDSTPEAPRQPTQPPPGHERWKSWESEKSGWDWKDQRKDSWKDSWKEKDGKDGKGKGKSKKSWANEKQSGWSDWKDWKSTSKESWSQGAKWGKEDGWEHDNRERERASEKEFALTHKITFDDSLDEKFPLGARLIGKGGRNTKQITKETGAWVWLAGKGSGLKDPSSGAEADEPLHLLVKSDDQESLDEAVRQTNALIDAVLEQYSVWLEKGGAGGAGDSCYECGEPGHIARFCPTNKGKGKGKEQRGEKRSWEGYETSGKWARR